MSTAQAAALDRAATESLLAFWVEAGVDVCLEDGPVDRLRPVGLAEPRLPGGDEPPTLPPLAVEAPAASAPAIDEGRAAADARQAARGAGDLAALTRAIATFEGCPLKTLGARQAVFCRGRGDAPLVIVGEGPGAEEDARGEPFVGRAGRLLDVMLRHAGLFERCFITNTVFWRPPGNRTPTQAEQQVCAPFLERAIEMVKPKLILTVGGSAAAAVLRAEDGILAARGRWREWVSTDGERRLPAMATLHPAFLLRQPEAKKKAWADLLAVAERLDRLDAAA